MHLRNGGHGYGVVTKALHWLTVLAIVAQFAVGLTMSRHDEGADEAADRAEERFEQDLERRRDAAEARGEAAEEQFDEEADRLEDAFRARQRAEGDAEDSDVSALHVGLGITVFLLGLVRLLWRRTTPLPPWAEHLGPLARSWESWLEKALLALLLVVPATGLLLVLVSTDWVAVHVTAQLLLVTVIVLHVGLVLKHTVVHRQRHLARML